MMLWIIVISINYSWYIFIDLVSMFKTLWQIEKLSSRGKRNHIFTYFGKIQAVAINDSFFSIPTIVNFRTFHRFTLFFSRPAEIVSLELRARRNSRNACKINRDARNSLLLATGNMCCPFATLLGWLAWTGEMLD